MMRRCASAVVCSRSMASVANATAVSKPKQLVVPTMSLSIVLGTPTIGMPRHAELVGDGERAVAADDDERVEPHLVEHLDDAVGVVAACRPTSRSDAANGLPRLIVPRIVPPSRRMPVTSRGVSTRERPGSIRPSKLSSRPMHSMPAVGGGLDDRADDRVEAGCVAAAGEDADACDRGCHGSTIANAIDEPIARSDTATIAKCACYTEGSSFRKWAASSVGRAPRSQRGGHEFEPRCRPPDFARLR